jgi:predicted histone-like DNA-binding protein
MTVKYKIVKRKNTLTDKKDRYYAKAAPQGEIDLDALCQHMSMHNTPYSKGQIHGVLKDFINCFAELLQDGYKVRLPGLGLFGIGMTAVQVAKPGDFVPTKHIKGYHMTCSTLTSREQFYRALGKVKLQELPKYVVNRKDKSDTTPSDTPNP